MSKATDYRIVVSGMMGTVYIAKPSKQPNVMLADRRAVPEHEFMEAIIHWTAAKLEDGANTIEIKRKDGQVDASITLSQEIIKQLVP